RPLRLRRLADLDQVLAEIREVLDPAVADDDVVLDSDPADALEIDARFHRDDVAGTERVGGLLRHSRRLVDLDPEPVAQTVADLAFGRAAVGLRSVWTGGHDRLEACGGTLGVEELVDPPGDVTLRAPVKRLIRQPLVDAIRDRARATDCVELLLVLHSAQRFDEARPWDELEASGAEGLVAGVRDECRLEADAARQPARE